MEETKKGSALRSLFLDRWRPYFWIIVACLLLYFKTLAFRFTFFDDNELILNNIAFLRDFSHCWNTFRQSAMPGVFDAYYRPLHIISFILDAQFSGLSPFGYHLTNLLLHVGSSVLVFLFFCRLGYGRKPGFFFALIFAVHPVLNETVAWIPGRNDSLLAIFLLLSFIALFNYLDTRKLSSWLFHLFFFACALLTKELAVVIVPMAVLYLYLVRREAGALRRLPGLLAGWSAITVCWWVVRRSALPHGSAGLGDRLRSLLEASPALLQYFGKVFIPVHLSPTPNIQDTPFVYGIAAVLLVGAVLAFARNKNLRNIFFGLSWFLLFLLPTLLLEKNAYLEYRIYVPFIGLFFVAGETRELLTRSGTFRRFLPFLGVAFLGVLTFLSLNNSDTYMNGLSLWKKAVETAPHSTAAHSNLGVIYLNNYGATDAAAREFAKVYELDPGNKENYYNIAILSLRTKRFKEAEGIFQYLLQKSTLPKSDIYYNYGGLCFEEGRFNEATALWKKAIAADPSGIDAYVNLAMYYRREKDTVAYRYYRTLLETTFIVREPLNYEATDNSWIYLQRGAHSLRTGTAVATP